VRRDGDGYGYGDIDMRRLWWGWVMEVKMLADGGGRKVLMQEDGG
jgi:hypothetical protein